MNDLNFFNSYSINKKVKSINDSIRVDMGLDGDDAFYFLKDLEETFNVSIIKELDFCKFFHTEYELFNSKKPKEIEKELQIIDLLKMINENNTR